MRFATIGGLFQPAYLWQAVRIFAACAISYGLSSLIGFEEAYWAPISAVFVAQPELKATFVAARDRVIATLIGAATGLGVLQAARSGMHSLPLFWAAMIPPFNLECCQAEPAPELDHPRYSGSGAINRPGSVSTARPNS